MDVSSKAGRRAPAAGRGRPTNRGALATARHALPRWSAGLALGLGALCHAAWSQDLAAATVRSVDLGTQLPPVARDALTASARALVGQSLTHAQAEAQARAETARLRQAGYPVGLVVLLPQDWARFRTTGALNFHVFVGDVGAVRIGKAGNTSRVSDGHLLATARQALCGPAGLPCVLTSAGLERAQLLLQDLPGVRLQSLDFSPAGVGRGQTAVEIEAGPAGPWASGTVTADNEGDAYSGHGRLGVSAVLTNLLHAGDVLEVGATRSSRATTSVSLGLSAPVGDQGFRVRAGYDHSHFTMSQVQSTDTVDTASAALSYAIVRGLDHDWTASATAFDSHSRQTVAGQPAFAARHLDGVRLSLTGDSGERSKALAMDAWSFQLTATGGHAGQHVDGTDPSGVLGAYGKLAASLLVKHNLSDGWYLLGNLRGQLAGRNLDDSERLAVGGASGLRAYRPEEGQLDQGLLASVELRRALNLGGGDQLVPGVFVDALTGRIVARPYPGWQTTQGYANANLSDRRSLRDWGLGVDWYSHRGVTASVSLARRLPGSPDSINYPGSARFRLLASMGYSF